MNTRVVFEARAPAPWKRWRGFRVFYALSREARG